MPVEDANDMRQKECEFCGDPAITTDPEGWPYCESCLDEALNSASKQIADTNEWIATMEKRLSDYQKTAP